VRNRKIDRPLALGRKVFQKDEYRKMGFFLEELSTGK